MAYPLSSSLGLLLCWSANRFSIGPTVRACNHLLIKIEQLSEDEDSEDEETRDEEQGKKEKKKSFLQPHGGFCGCNGEMREV